MLLRHFRTFIAISLAASAVLLVNSPFVEASVPAPFDSTFGTDGVATHVLPLQRSESRATDIVNDASGNLYVLLAATSGNNDETVSVAKYSSSGIPISAFGSNGRTQNFDLSNSNFALQADGKIVIAGFQYSNNQARIVVYRLTTSGQIDTTFGTDGVYTQPNFPGKWIGGNTIQLVIDSSANRIYLAFNIDNIDNSNQNFYFIALNSSGVVDSNWGTNGAREISPRGGPVSAYSSLSSMVLLSDGSLLGIGSAIGPSNGLEIVLTKLNSNGYLDLTFDGASSGNGIVFIQFASETDAYMSAATVLQDDSVVLAGRAGTYFSGPWYYGITKVLSNGTVDTSFGSSGFKLSSLQMDYNTATPRRLGIQTDGRYVFPINSGTTAGFMRVETNGTFSNSPNCFQCLWSGANDGVEATSLVVQSDSKIVVTGSLRSEKDSIIRRFTSAGVADGSFTNIRYQVNAEKWTSYIDSVQQLPDGSILGFGLGQTVRNNQDISRIAIYKFTSNGAFDTQFGNGGYTFLSSSVDVSWINTSDFAIQPDGKILVLATGYSNGRGMLLMWRTNSDGALDNSFGTNGFVSTSDSGADILPTNLIVTSDGRILVALTKSVNFVGAPWIYRYQSNGSLDSSFTDSNNFSGGKNPSIGDGTGYVNYMVPATDGKFFVAGSTTINSNIHSYLAKFLANGTLDTTFSGGYVSWESQLSYSMNYITNNVVDSDGKIFVFGQSSSPASTGIVFQLNADGSRNNSFNGTGYKVLPFRDSAQIDYSEASEAVLNNGVLTIIGGGDSNPAQYQSSNFSSVARMSVNGVLDSDFGSNGFIDPFPSTESYFSDIAPLSNGMSVIAGSKKEGTEYKMILMKIGATSSSPTTTTPTTTAPSTTTTTVPVANTEANDDIKLVISVTQTAILKKLKLTVSSGSKVSMKSMSPKVCKVVKTKVIASSTGTCRISVTITDKKKKKTTKSTTFRVT